MQITLVQAEIEEAIKNYVNDQVNIRDGMQITIDLRAGRGADGFTANVDISKEGTVVAKTVVPAVRKEEPQPEPTPAPVAEDKGPAFRATKSLIPKKAPAPVPEPVKADPQPEPEPEQKASPVPETPAADPQPEPAGDPKSGAPFEVEPEAKSTPAEAGSAESTDAPAQAEATDKPAASDQPRRILFAGLKKPE